MTHSTKRQAVIDQIKKGMTWAPRRSPSPLPLPDTEEAIRNGFPVTKCEPAYCGPFEEHWIHPRSMTGAKGRVK